jgi:hypothetical protein
MTTAAKQRIQGAGAAVAAGPKFFGRNRGVIRSAFKIGIYGPEGIGKSTLAAGFPGVVFADLEQSTRDLDVERVEGIERWEDLRAWVQSVTPNDYKAICIDSMTRAEDWAADWVIRNKQSNDGTKATDSLEDFKYKAGATFVCDAMGLLLNDLERAFLSGVNIIMIAHNRAGKLRNSEGSDYWRNEPRLIHVENAQGVVASHLNRWAVFLDELYFIDYDVQAAKGKATGSGSRTLYVQGLPTRMAKTRVLPPAPIEYTKGAAEVWSKLLKTDEAPI